MMKYIGNAFSLSMLVNFPAKIWVMELSTDEAKKFVESGAESAIGHESTAQVLSRILGTDIKAERKMIRLEAGDELLVFQLMTRLPEGKVLSEEEILSLPYKFFLVKVY